MSSCRAANANRIGGLGAIVADPPETSKITGAIERMRAAIASAESLS